LIPFLGLGFPRPSERKALICKLLQRWDWMETAQVSGLSGRGQVIALLRTAVGKLIELDS